MKTFALRLSCVFAAALLPAIAGAQSPPIKPGLWEVKSDRGGDGAKRAQSLERMKNMPPEARAKFDAMMKERGMSMDADGNSRVCLSKASLEAGAWQRQASCKTDYSSRSGSSWKWHTVCTQPEAESDGEASFPNSETYSVNVATTMKIGGQTRVTHRTMNAKWLGSNCGDLKPVDPRQ